MTAKESQWEPKREVAGLAPNVPLITLNINGIKTQIKRDWQKWVRGDGPRMFSLQETP